MQYRASSLLRFPKILKIAIEASSLGADPLPELCIPADSAKIRRWMSVPITGAPVAAVKSHGFGIGQVADPGNGQVRLLRGGLPRAFSMNVRDS
jgi:hypothetical protein